MDGNVANRDEVERKSFDKIEINVVWEIKAMEYGK